MAVKRTSSSASCWSQRETKVFFGNRNPISRIFWMDCG